MKRALILVSLALIACDSFEYHPFELRNKPDERDLNAASIARIQALAPRDTVRFVFIGDTQRFYDNLSRLVKSANNQSYDFMIVAGDLTEYGLQKEMSWVHRELRNLHRPYVTCIGNHDFVGAGRELFERMYGPVNVTFRFGDFQFVIHDTNSRENWFEQTPDMPWLQQKLSDHTGQSIVVGHTPPISEDFDPEMVTAYTNLLAQAGVQLALFGHEHRLVIDELYGDGVTYVVCPALETRYYLMITAWNTGYNIDMIEY